MSVSLLQDYDDFDVANEDDELEEFLKIERRTPKSTPSHLMSSASNPPPPPSSSSETDPQQPNSETDRLANTWSRLKPTLLLWRAVRIMMIRQFSNFGLVRCVIFRTSVFDHTFVRKTRTSFGHALMVQSMIFPPLYTHTHKVSCGLSCLAPMSKKSRSNERRSTRTSCHPLCSHCTFFNECI